MAWYAVSAVLYFKLREVPEQEEFFVWENVYLVNAASFDEARGRGEAIGRAAGNEKDDSLRWNGRPADLTFAGIRKVISCAPNVETTESLPAETIHEGVEATYSCFTVHGKAALDELVSGAPVTLVYEE
jgi:hypothetical protein